MNPKTVPMHLEAAYFITPKVKHFIFKPMSSVSHFNYRPGQFITFFFEVNGKTLRRSYSIANPPGSDKIEIAVGKVEGGPGTSYLFNLKPGDIVNIAGPYGRLVLKDEMPKRMIFAATSTGITPLRAMLVEIEKKFLASPDFKLVILLGVRTRDELLYLDEWRQLAQNFKQVECRFHLSQMPKNQLQPCEFEGHVQASFNSLNLNPLEDLVYLCGNPSMIDQSFDALTSMGFNSAQIIREKYISN